MDSTSPFFIVAFPRSGTTLLQSMLNMSDRVFIPPETQCLCVLNSRRCRTLDWTRDSDFAQVLEMIRTHSCLSNELPVEWDRLVQQLSSAPRTPMALYQALLHHLADRQPPGILLGDKSPMHLLYADQILKHFPSSRVIVMVRDGRDVAASHRIAFHTDVVHTALRWRYYQALHWPRARRWPDDRYRLVYYENLVRNPEESLQNLCGFLKIPFTAKMLEYHERSSSGFAARETHKLRTFDPLTRSRIGHFQSNLRPDELSAIQLVARKQLVRHGYRLEPAPMLRGLAHAAQAVPRAVATSYSKRRSQFTDNPQSQKNSLPESG